MTKISFSCSFSLKKIIDYLKNPAVVHRLLSQEIETTNHPLEYSQNIYIKELNEIALHKVLANGFTIRSSKFKFTIQVADNKLVEAEVSVQKPWLRTQKAHQHKMKRFLHHVQTTILNDLTILDAFVAPEKLILISGTNGLIGRQLCSFLLLAGHNIAALERNHPKPGSVYWNPEKKELDASALTEIDGLIHLAAENIDGSWTKQKKEKIATSRIESTKFLAEKLQEQKLNFVLCASAVGIYEPSCNLQTEHSPYGSDFLAEVCKKWEDAAHLFRADRIVPMRFGVVLAKKASAFQRMIRSCLFHLGLTSEGQTYFSWITLDDAIYTIYQILCNKKIKSPTNITSKNPVLIEGFYKTLSAHMRKELLFSLPVSFILKGEKMRALLQSKRVISNTAFMHLEDDLNIAFDHLL